MRLGAINQTGNRGSFVKGDDPRRNPGGRPPGVVNKITRTMKNAAVGRGRGIGPAAHRRMD
jgi:hypothetical protein